MTDTRGGRVDFAGVAAALQQQSLPETDTRQPWQPLDPSAILEALRNGIDLTPEAGVWRRDDGAGMLYPGRSSIIMSSPESMKTWACMVAAVQVMGRGGAVGWVDFEDSHQMTLARLVALGAPIDMIATRFDYLQPEQPLVSSYGVNGEAMDKLDQWLTERTPELLVIDAFGPLAGMHGFSVLDNDEMTRLMRTVNGIAERTDAAILMVDHVAKSSDGRYPIGAQAKSQLLTGTLLLLDMRAPFGIGKHGEARIQIVKDRAGGVRQHAVGSDRIQELATLHLRSNAATGKIGWEIASPDTAQPLPTIYMEKVSTYLAACGADGADRQAIHAHISASQRAPMSDSARLALDAAIGHLGSLGYATHTDKDRWIHVRAYTAPEEDSSDPTADIEEF